MLHSVILCHTYHFVCVCVCVCVFVCDKYGVHNNSSVCTGMYMYVS